MGHKNSEPSNADNHENRLSTWSRFPRHIATNNTKAHEFYLDGIGVYSCIRG
jgi:hypothetical protein